MMNVMQVDVMLSSRHTFVWTPFRPHMAVHQPLGQSRHVQTHAHYKHVLKQYLLSTRKAARVSVAAKKDAALIIRSVVSMLLINV